MDETGHPKRKLAAVLSIDVVGYSRLMQDDEEATLETLRHYRAAFPSAVEAVRAAIDIQEGIEARDRELPERRRMRLRIIR